MLTSIYLHPGRPAAPHDIYSSWNLDPLTVTGLVIVAVLYRHGRSDRDGDRWFWAGLGAVAVAILSPLDAASEALATAHMVQHLLLVLVAAPLLAASGATRSMSRSLPRSWRRRAGRVRRRLRLSPAQIRRVASPASLWLASASTLWFWHGAVPYQAALENATIHLVEHGAFLVTGVLFWSTILPTSRRAAASPGMGVLLVFAMAVQSVVLAMLMTFATTPWYPHYAATAPDWGLTVLTDQQLAGAVMWIPAGFVYTAIGLALLGSWLSAEERPAGHSLGRAPSRSVGETGSASSGAAGLNRRGRPARWFP